MRVLLDRRPIGRHLGLARDGILDVDRRDDILDQEEGGNERAVGDGQAAEHREPVRADIVLQRLDAAHHLAGQQIADAVVAGGAAGLAGEHKHVVHQIDVGQARDGADGRGLTRRVAQKARPRIDLLEVLRDHLGFRDDGAVGQFQRRDAPDRRGLPPVRGAETRRPLQRDVLDALGVDLHPDLGRVRAEIAGIELHGATPPWILRGLCAAGFRAARRRFTPRRRPAPCAYGRLCRPGSLPRGRCGSRCRDRAAHWP